MNKRNAKTSLALELLEQRVIEYNNVSDDKKNIIEWLVGYLDFMNTNKSIYDLTDEDLINILMESQELNDDIYCDDDIDQTDIEECKRRTEDLLKECGLK